MARNGKPTVEARRREWLEADGLGGFASGTAAGIRTRRYHALLLNAAHPPTDRRVLVNGVDAWIESPGQEPIWLSAQQYGPNMELTAAEQRIVSFSHDPWPHWSYEIASGQMVEHEIVVPHGEPAVLLIWRLDRLQPGQQLCVRPFFSGRDYHSLQRQNDLLDFSHERVGDAMKWQTYPGVPPVYGRTNGAYEAAPVWYLHFYYEREIERGLDCDEDLASPGVLRWQAGAGEAVLLFYINGASEMLTRELDCVKLARQVRAQERGRRAAWRDPLARAADSYIVRRGNGKTIIAGYPWFADWGRDTFIAIRGLCYATGRWAEAAQILGTWAEAISVGMLPNRFPDKGEEPEYNSVDASLWYVVALGELMEAARQGQFTLALELEQRLARAIEAILKGYAKGSRYNIGMAVDGLLAAGQPGVQLTWMDAKVGEAVITPRIGKPVEVNALWINALWIGAQRDGQWLEVFNRARESFGQRFWNEERGCLFDVVDADHEPGKNDPAFRPNQIFAVGGLPLQLMDGERGRRVVEQVEQQLWTEWGLRSLAPGEPGYAGHYRGGVAQRDAAYHQGTVWPWLAGPFVEAWVRVRGNEASAKTLAREKFIKPLREKISVYGLGHVAEVADADAPHQPGGCPFQAWSVAELLRLENLVLKS
jgi:predicted glycogen debranching enzyme